MAIAILMAGVFAFPATARAADVATWAEFVTEFENVRLGGGTIDLTADISKTTNDSVTLSAVGAVTINTNDYGITITDGTLSLGGDIDIIRTSDGAPISVYNGANLVLGGNVSVTGTNFGLIVEGGGAATLTGSASIQSSSTGTGVAVRESANGSGSLNVGENSEIDGGSVGVFCAGNMQMSGGRVDVSETGADAILVDGGNATITSGVINATGEGGSGVNVLAGGSLDYHGGTIRAMGASGVGVIVDGGSTLTTYGGLIEGAENGVSIGSAAGDVVLYNGNIQSNQPGDFVYLEDDTPIWVYSATGLRESDMHWDIQGAPVNYVQRDSFGITAPQPHDVELTLGQNKTVDFTVQGQGLNGDAVSLQDHLGNAGALGNATYTVAGDSITFTPTQAGQRTISINDTITYNGLWTIQVTVVDPAANPPANPPAQNHGNGSQSQGLTESTTGVTVSGPGIRGGTKLILQPLSLDEPGQCAACDAIRQYMADNHFTVLFDADLSLSRSYSGGLTLTIPVGAQYNGQTLTLLHCHDGSLETLTATVVDGQAVFTVGGLSPVALVADTAAITNAATTGDSLDSIPITGDSGSALIWWLLCGLSAAGIALLITLGLRKKSFQN